MVEFSKKINVVFCFVAGFVVSLFSNIIILEAEAAFNPSQFPGVTVLYYTQWGVYGGDSNGKGPPFNWFTAKEKGSKNGRLGDTKFAGSFEGRHFFISDIEDNSSKFFPPQGNRTINFAFAGLDMNTCEIRTVDYYADFEVGVGGKCLGKGESDSSLPIKGLAGHACAIRNSDPSHSLQFYLSIGGWEMSSQFGRCAATGEYNNLISSVEWFLENYGFTGLEINWQFPSKTGCKGGADDPCKFVVSKNLEEAHTYLTTNSKPESWTSSVKPGYVANPSFMIPASALSPGSVGGDIFDGAEQCHSGDPGVAYRICDDGYLVSRWVVDSCPECPSSSPQSNCMLKNHEKCMASNMYNACVCKFGQAVSSHPDCKELAQIFKTPSGESEVQAFPMRTQGSKDWFNLYGLVVALQHLLPSKVTVALGMTDDLISGNDKNYPEICENAEYVNVMTYNFYGASTPPYHNAPLYADPQKKGQAGYNSHHTVAESVNNLIKAGCQPEQISLGIPLFGHSYENSAMGFGAFGSNSVDHQLGVGTYRKGTVSYWDIHSRFLPQQSDGICDNNPDLNAASLPQELLQCSKWQVSRDMAAGCVPHLHRSNGSKNDYISYDDAVSITLKAKWARCMGLRGLTFWEAADDRNGVLTETAYKAWNSVKEVECAGILKNPTSCDFDLPQDSPVLNSKLADLQKCIDTCIDCSVAGTC